MAGERAHVPVEVVATDGIQDDVGAAVARRVEQGGDEVLFPVVDEDLGPESAAGLELLLAPRGDRDLAAAGPRELDGHGPDSARASMHEERLSRAQGGRHEDVRPHRGDRFGQRCGVDEIDGVRHGEKLAGCGDGQFGVPAAAEQGADAVADGDIRHAVAECGDGARDLEAGPVRRTGRRGIGAHSLVQVGPIDPGCGDLDEHFAAPRDKVIDLARYEHLRPTRPADGNGQHDLHGTPSRRGYR